MLAKDFNIRNVGKNRHTTDYTQQQRLPNQAVHLTPRSVAALTRQVFGGASDLYIGAYVKAERDFRIDYGK